MLVVDPVLRTARTRSSEFAAAASRAAAWSVAAVASPPSAPPQLVSPSSALRLGTACARGRAPPAQSRVQRRRPPTRIVAGRRRRLATHHRQRPCAIRAVGLRSDSPDQPRRPQATVALGSRSNRSRSGQNLVNRSNPAGFSSFTENPQIFRNSQIYPSTLEVFLQISPFSLF
jgi:hypothetical protein